MLNYFDKICNLTTDKRQLQYIMRRILVLTTVITKLKSTGILTVLSFPVSNYEQLFSIFRT
jgi:hypothetical protein